MALVGWFTSSAFFPKFSGTQNRPELASHLFSGRRRATQPDAPCVSRRYAGQRRPVPVASVLKSDAPAAAMGSVRIVAVVGEGSTSPLKGAPWEEVILHTAKRLQWVDEGFEMLVLTDNPCNLSYEYAQNLKKELQCTDILMVVAVTNQQSVRWIQEHSKNVHNIICFESSSSLVNKLGGSLVKNDGTGSKFLFAQSQQQKDEKKLVETITRAWERHNSDDIRFCLLVIINAYIKPVSILQNLHAKGFSTLSCMVRNCGPQILNCLLDPNCRKALQCMNKCSPVDQVCNYRCIASYESPNLEAFSLCALQKHNCLELNATIPKKPFVPPMAIFQGKNLSHEVAEDLFIGWLGNLNWSWRVVAGQNPAYDHFPCQYHLFYRGKARGSFWYEPVFQVKTLDGKNVWRRKRYQVTRSGIPGTFHFNFLGNGVMPNEFWTIVDVADDLSWGLFHYHGAVRVAGQSYTGAILVSPDGKYPYEAERGRLSQVLDKFEIKEWELFNVDNCSCVDPPLGLPEGSSLHCKIEVGDLCCTL